MSFFRSSLGLLQLLLVVAAVLSLSSFPTASAQSEGSVCFLFYGLPGTVDYPWSASVLLDVVYDPSLQSGSYYSIQSGQATYKYTDKTGVAKVTSSQQAFGAIGSLYVDSSLPVDTTGISVPLDGTFQLPSVGQATSSITLKADPSGAYVDLGDAFSLDTAGQAWVANGIPGFADRTLGSSNINSLSVNYATCQAAINFNNGKVPAFTPTSADSASAFHWSYGISDGVTYIVNTTFVVSTAANPDGSPVLSVDQLGNTYQTITSIRGARFYTYLPTGLQIITPVTGVSSTGGGNQRWYPYTQLQSSPGVYTTPVDPNDPNAQINLDRVPYFDGEGLSLALSTSAPFAGSPTTAQDTNTITVQIQPPTLGGSQAVITEAGALTPPLFSNQVQLYALPMIG